MKFSLKGFENCTVYYLPPSVMIQNSSITKNILLFCPSVINSSSTFNLRQPVICSPIPYSLGFCRMSYKWNHTMFRLVGVHWALGMYKCMSTKCGSWQPLFLQIFFLHKSLCLLLWYTYDTNVRPLLLSFRSLSSVHFLQSFLIVQIVQLLSSFLQLFFPLSSLCYWNHLMNI